MSIRKELKRACQRQRQARYEARMRAGATDNRLPPQTITITPSHHHRFHDTAANERRASDLSGEADQTNLTPSHHKIISHAQSCR